MNLKKKLFELLQQQKELRNISMPFEGKQLVSSKRDRHIFFVYCFKSLYKSKLWWSKGIDF